LIRHDVRRIGKENLGKFTEKVYENGISVYFFLVYQGLEWQWSAMEKFLEKVYQNGISIGFLVYQGLDLLVSKKEKSHLHTCE